MNFWWNEFMLGRLVIHTGKEYFADLMDICQRHGVLWSSQLPLTDYTPYFKPDLCIRYNKELGGISYAYIDFYERMKSVSIMEFEKFEQLLNPEPDESLAGALAEVLELSTQ